VTRQAELIKRAETIQKSLSNYIDDQLLNSTEFTVWDRAWAANEEVRGGCCNSAEDRMELGRLRYFGEPLNERVAKNPIKKQVEKGGGIFEMDWRDRVKMLRQLVDWQCMLTSPSSLKDSTDMQWFIQTLSERLSIMKPRSHLPRRKRRSRDCP